MKNVITALLLVISSHAQGQVAYSYEKNGIHPCVNEQGRPLYIVNFLVYFRDKGCAGVNGVGAIFSCETGRFFSRYSLSPYKNIRPISEIQGNPDGVWGLPDDLDHCSTLIAERPIIAEEIWQDIQQFVGPTLPLFEEKKGTLPEEEKMAMDESIIRAHNDMKGFISSELPFDELLIKLFWGQLVLPVSDTYVAPEKIGEIAKSLIQGPMETKSLESGGISGYFSFITGKLGEEFRLTLYFSNLTENDRGGMKLSKASLTRKKISPAAPQAPSLTKYEIQIVNQLMVDFAKPDVKIPVQLKEFFKKPGDKKPISVATLYTALRKLGETQTTIRSGPENSIE